MFGRSACLGLLLLAACSAGDDGTRPSDDQSEVQLVGGQVVCDSCTSARIVLAGAGIDGVRSATLVTSDLARTTLPARINIDRESGASGDQLILTAFFDQGVLEGVFDLWLDPPSAGDAARVVPAALRVTRARPGPGTQGTVRVYVTVSGVDRDLGYTLRTVAGCEPSACPPMPVSAFIGVSQSLSPGTYTFRLEDVGENCTLSGSPNPATLELPRGVPAALSYRLTCVPVANPGWVRVSNVTTGPGPDLDEGYKVSCTGLDCRTFTLVANRDTVLRLPAGQLTLGFSDVAPHCSLAGPSTVTLAVSAGDTATAAFPVTCRERPSINVTVRTTGRDIVDVVHFSMCYDNYYTGFCRYQAASSNGTTAFAALTPGTYHINLSTYYLPENCTPSGQLGQTVEVQSSAVFVDFAITCLAYGTVRISTVTSGTNQDAGYVVVRPSGCDDYSVPCDRQLIASSGSVEFRTAPGSQTFLLTDVAPNCTVVAPGNPATVAAIEDTVVELRYEVACH